MEKVCKVCGGDLTREEVKANMFWYTIRLKTKQIYGNMYMCTKCYDTELKHEERNEFNEFKRPSWIGGVGGY